MTTANNCRRMRSSITPAKVRDESRRETPAERVERLRQVSVRAFAEYRRERLKIESEGEAA